MAAIEEIRKLNLRARRSLIANVLFIEYPNKENRMLAQIAFGYSMKEDRELLFEAIQEMLGEEK